MSDKTSLAFAAVQNAVYSRLTSPPSPRAALTCGLYDEVPMATEPPYAVFGEPTDFDFEARGVKGRLVNVPIRVYSRDAGGKAQVYSLMTEIVEILTLSKMTISGWSEVWKTARSGAAVRDTNEPGMTYVGIVSIVVCVCKT